MQGGRRNPRWRNVSWVIRFQRSILRPWIIPNINTYTQDEITGAAQRNILRDVTIGATRQATATFQVQHLRRQTRKTLVLRRTTARPTRVVAQSTVPICRIVEPPSRAVDKQRHQWHHADTILHHVTTSAGNAAVGTIVSTVVTFNATEEAMTVHFKVSVRAVGQTLATK